MSSTNEQQPGSSGGRLRFALRSLTLFCAMAFAVAPLCGFQGLFPALQKRHVFHDLCKDDAISNTTSTRVTCSKQHAAVAEVGNIAMAVMNGASLVNGVMISVFGGWICGIVGMLMWTVSVGISGIQPGLGWFWATGAVGTLWSCSLIYLSLVGFYFIELFPNPESLSTVMAAVSGLWDAFSVGSVLVGDLFEIDAVPLWAWYLGYALLLGIPCSLGMARLWKREGEIVKAIGVEKTLPLDDGIADERTSLIGGAVNKDTPAQASAPTVCDKFLETFRAAKRLSKRLLFWGVLIRATTVVLVGYLFLDNVRPLVLYAKQGSPVSDKCVNDATTICTYLMGSSAVASVALSVLCRVAGTERAVLIVSVADAFWAAGSLAMFLSKGVLTSDSSSCVGPWFYVAFFLMLTYRVGAFSMMNIAVPVCLLPDEPEVVGVCFGLVYGIGGIISAIVGAVVTSLLHANPTTATPVFLVVALSSVGVVELFSAYCHIREKRLREAKKASEAADEEETP